MSILVRREQEKYFLAENCEQGQVNYGTVKRQADAEVSRFKVCCLEAFFFRSQQLTLCIKLFTHENTI